MSKLLLLPPLLLLPYEGDATPSCRDSLLHVVCGQYAWQSQRTDSWLPLVERGIVNCSRRHKDRLAGFRSSPKDLCVLLHSGALTGAHHDHTALKNKILGE